MLGSLLLCLTLLPFGADQTPAPASPIKIEAVKRSGYSLVSLSATDAKLTIKKSEFIAIGNGTTIEITSDQSGNSLVVTSPPSGTVIVYVVALMSDGELVPAQAIEIPAAGTPTTPTPMIPGPGGTPPPTQPPAPTVPTTAGPLAGEKNLRVTLVMNLAAPGKPEQDLVAFGSPTAQSLKQALGGLGHTFHVADINSALFRQALAAAAAVSPNVPAPTETPFLFIEKADRSFRAAFRLHLSPDPRANAAAIMAIFGGSL